MGPAVAQTSDHEHPSERRATTKSRAVSSEMLVLVGTLASVAVPFLNSMLAGLPGESASVDARYAQVLGSATMGMLALEAWRVHAFATLGERLRLAAIALAAMVAIVATLQPREPFWVTLLSLEFLAFFGYLTVTTSYGLARDRTLGLGARRVLVLAVALICGPLFATLMWAVVATQLSVAVARYAHQEPVRDSGEEDVEFRSADGTLIRGTFRAGREGAPAVILMHGLGDGRTQMAGWADAAQVLSFHTLRFDWRAHGTSEGSITTFCDRELLDLDAAFEWLKARDDVDGQRIVLVGNSMGGGAAMASAGGLRARGLGGIVAFAPPLDYGPLADARLAFLGPLLPIGRTLVFAVAHGLGQRAPYELAPGVAYESGRRAPVLIFHGDADPLIDVARPIAFAERFRWVELHVVPGADHREIPVAVLDDEDLRRRVLTFLRTPRARPTSATDG